MKKVGIDAISFYIPSIYVGIEELATKRNIEYAKLNKGLGLNKMAFPDCNEDAASFAANALLELITKNNIDPRTIGRIYMGTESALDSSKPTCTYAIEPVELELSTLFGSRCFKNCDVLDMTFACIGAVDALHNSVDWVANGENRKAVVIASDVAKYDLESTGEYTQGAGAVAVLITENPDIISITNTIGVATKSVGDFFKPRRVFSKLNIIKQTATLLGKEISDDEAKKILNENRSEFWSNANVNFELFMEEPVFDGPYSNECYQDRIFEALEHFNSQKQINILNDWQHLIFHLPYAFQARRMIVKKWITWLEENGTIHTLYDEVGKPDEHEEKNWLRLVSKSKVYHSFLADKIVDGEKASSEIGNMYTASIFMSLLSLLNISYDDNRELSSNKVGFFSYGSGSKAKVFEGVIEKNWKQKIKSSHLFHHLEKRTEIDIETYENLHKNEITKPISKNTVIGLSHINNESNRLGLREYKPNTI
jgi:hydroxymethylglutaryl-CoA synthase